MALTLRRRILAGYGLVLALFAVVLAVALVAFARYGRSSENIVRENYRSIRAANGMLDALERQDSGALLYLLGAGEPAARQVRTHQRAFDGWLAQTAGNVTIPGERAYVERIGRAAAAYRAALEAELAGPAPDPARGRALYRERLLPAFAAVRRAAVALRDLNQRAMAAAAVRDREASRSGVAALALLGGGALLFGLAFSLLLSTRLAAPVRRLEAAARRVATGDYDAEVPEGAADEIGRLSAAFNEMAGALRTYRALESERAVQVQRRSAAVVQAIEDGVVVVDARLGVLDHNPVAAAALGAAPGGLRGRRLDEVAPGAPFLGATREAAAGRSFASAGAGFVATPGGGEYEAVVTPMAGPSGAPLGAVLLLRDVTALRQVDRLKSDFVATASHELRTPLTSLGMSVGLLQERSGHLGEQERALVASAAADVARLRALTDDLLDLSRIEAGAFEVVPRPVAPAALVGEAGAAFAVPAEAAGLALAANARPGLPDVRADAERVRRVLANLVANAIRHTPPGGRVAVRAVEGGPGAVRFEVEDTGEGVASEDQARIFGRFVQVHGSRAAGGSGLGLTLAKELVEAHGGRIGVRSARGAGATFWFTLPTG